MSDELANHVRRVIDQNRYMTLGTTDEVGDPWVSPVWFATEDHIDFHWVSSPDAKHSRNLAVHPKVAIAIFDSSVPVGGGEAVFMKGVGSELSGVELERGLDIFDRQSQQQIGSNWTMEEVQGSSLFRLFSATISEYWVLVRGSDPERGSGVDRSERVWLDRP